MSRLHHPGNLAIVAGAGTGKTYSLTERFLYYLQERDYSALSIVAVTFTRKAATELRARIRARVRSVMPERFDVLAELEAAQISTIHELAARICREHPHEAGVPPDFTLLDEQEGTIFNSELLEGALGAINLEFFHGVPYSTMKKFLERMLADPVSATRALEQGTEQWLMLPERFQSLVRDEFLESEAWQNALRVLDQFRGDPKDRIEQCRITAIECQERFSATGNPAHLQELVEIKLTGGSEKKWLGGGFSEVKDVIKALRDEGKKILPLLMAALSDVDTQLEEVLPVLQEAFRQAKAYVDGALHENNYLNFALVEGGALRALAQPQVQEYYAQRWRAWLVDEF
jgi:ATP-dependent helicase/nuclease subunit A